MRTLFSICFLLLLMLSVAAQSWKEASEDSILKYRTTPVKITITGQPENFEEDITVHAKMLQHKFIWGSVVSITQIMRLIGNSHPVGSFTPYYNHFKLFNSITPGNAGKWKGWLDIQQRNVYLKTMKWFESEGIANRGHTCVWESERFNAIPDLLKGMTDTAEIRSAVKSHITSQMGVLKNYIYEVDVVNELVHEQHITRDLLNLSDPAIEHAKWYKWAKQSAPNVRLIANEFDLFQSGNTFYQKYISYVNKMIEEGAPVEGVGMQGHFWSAMPSYEELKNRIEQVKTLGLPMEVTEFDMVGSAYEDMEKVLYAVFSEPQIYNFTMWGAWDGSQWRNNGPLFYDNWSLKPSGKAWMDLVHGKWWTDTAFTIKTSTDLSFNAYKGKHIVELHKGNQVFVDTFFVDDEIVELQYDASLINSEKPWAEIEINNPREIYNIYQPVHFVVNSNMPDSIQKVEFMEGMFTLHRDTLKEFEFSFTSTAAGVRSLFARIFCKNGFIFNTDTLHTGFVNENAFPIITGTYPFDNQFFVVDSEIPVFCSAEDYEGGIWKMEVRGIYGDSVLIDTVAPYEVFVNDLRPGNYEINIKVLDSLHAFDQRTISFSVFDPDQQNISVSFPQDIDHDIEEEADGNIVLEGDLDMGDKMCGIFFPFPGVPKDATIDSAFIQFTADNTSLGNVTIPIFFELNSEPLPFSTQNANLSSRTEKTEVINWMPEEWEFPGERGSKQKSPDLKSLLSELQMLENWNESSPLVLISDFSAESSRRRVVSYDISKSNAPELTVYYRGGFEVGPPEPPVNLQFISQDAREFVLRWEKPENSDDIIGYFVYVDGKRYNSIPVSSNQIQIENISNNFPHEFYVKSLNNFSIESNPGNSIYSFPLTIDIETNNSDLKIYPNPFQSDIEILFPFNDSISRIDIFNLNGELLNSIEIPNNSSGIVLTEMQLIGGDDSAEVYLLRFLGKNKLYCRKLIKIKN